MLIEIAETHLPPPGKGSPASALRNAGQRHRCDGAGRVEPQLGKVTNAVTILRTAYKRHSASTIGFSPSLEFLKELIAMDLCAGVRAIESAAIELFEKRGKARAIGFPSVSIRHRNRP